MRNRRPLAVPALIAVAACSAAACSARRGQGAAADREPAMVVFENQSLYEAAVFAVPQGGGQTRLGTIQSGRTDTLRLGTGGRPVTIVARVLALRRTPSTGTLTLQSGEWIAVRLTSEAYTLTVLPLVR